MHTPTLNIGLPGNSFSFLKSLITIATFDIPKVEMATIRVWSIQESTVLGDMPANVVSSMDQLGYNDSNISATFGSVYVFTILSIFGLLGILLTYPLLRFTPAKKVHDYLKGTLIWNFMIRLFLEGCLESVFCFYLAFYYGSGF